MLPKQMSKASQACVDRQPCFSVIKRLADSLAMIPENLESINLFRPTGSKTVESFAPLTLHEIGFLFLAASNPPVTVYLCLNPKGWFPYLVSIS
jgi:hypothetical protein